MEYCEKTLRTYINKRNTDLSLGTRKRLALQFLFALNYLHTQGVLHRDISLQNVLLKEYASGAVLVKLSDFGLAKDADSRFTHTHTEFRGTIRDPALDSLKDYAIVNEVYAIAASARLQAHPHEWWAHLTDVANEMASVDYRQRERDVAALIFRGDWFERWRAHRPGTRTSSRAYAITWLWLHHAGGLLATSPTGSPSSSFAAGYRQFAQGLTDDWQASLVAVVRNGTSIREAPAARSASRPHGRRLRAGS